MVTSTGMDETLLTMISVLNLSIFTDFLKVLFYFNFPNTQVKFIFLVIQKAISNNLIGTIANIKDEFGALDLDRLRLHNLVEHDASMVHTDHYFAPDSYFWPNQTLVDGLIQSSRDAATIGICDLSRWRYIRYKDSLAHNPEFDFGFQRGINVF